MIGSFEFQWLCANPCMKLLLLLWFPVVPLPFLNQVMSWFSVTLVLCIPITSNSNPTTLTCSHTTPETPASYHSAILHHQFIRTTSIQSCVVDLWRVLCSPVHLLHAHTTGTTRVLSLCTSHCSFFLTPSPSILQSPIALPRTYRLTFSPKVVLAH